MGNISAIALLCYVLKYTAAATPSALSCIHSISSLAKAQKLGSSHLE